MKHNQESKSESVERRTQFQSTEKYINLGILRHVEKKLITFIVRVFGFARHKIVCTFK